MDDPHLAPGDALERVRPLVLVVDDEPDVIETLRELLRREFEVLGTTDPDEALALLAERDVALVLTDQRMPKRSGVELLARAAALSPQTVRVLFTGYSDIDAVIRAVNQGRIYRYVAKPWRPEELLEIVRESTRDYHLVEENRRLSRRLRTVAAASATAAADLERLEGEAGELAGQNEVLRAALVDLQESHWHLRRLQELLPMCMVCRKVRTGEEYWESVERYLLENSDFLTHGLCPECLATMEAGLDEG